MDALKPEKYRLRKGFSLTIDVGGDGEVIAYDPKLNAYGVGDTIYEAVADFSSMTQDLYEELQNSEEQLSTKLRAQLNYLRDLFVEVS
jgi:hypothetical protein